MEIGVVLVECSVDGHTSWSLGMHRSSMAAALRAVVAAVDHARRRGTKSRIAETIASGQSSGTSV
ncbi:Titin Z [Rhodococcus triatomae]|uniref:Titin Z n=1 Tax=Rhodococcus triatomae TaxID=300028 RepID=A0A1G8GQD5_9NOCA|nr:Titin Z [Rhodococcus triatomae]